MEKVRRIRNEREWRGHNPLLFFLKCLEADDARSPELIRDEIKARTFFVLCNTRASRRSKWVKQEIELAKQVTKRPRQTVVVMNLERDLPTELPKLDQLSKRAAVFLSYARQDQKIAEWIRRALQNHDYSVWFDSAVWPLGIGPPFSTQPLMTLWRTVSSCLSRSATTAEPIKIGIAGRIRPIILDPCPPSPSSSPSRP